MQRTGLVPPGTEIPNVRALASLEHLVGLLLRYIPPGEAVELLTEQVASVRDVAGVVRYRIGSWLRSLRRRMSVPVDEDGAGYRRMQEELAARRAQSTPEGRQAAKDIARQVRDRLTARPDTERHRRAEQAAADAMRQAREAERRRSEHVQRLRAQEAEARQAALRQALEEAAARREGRDRAIMRARQERREGPSACRGPGSPSPRGPGRPRPADRPPQRERPAECPPYAAPAGSADPAGPGLTPPLNRSKPDFPQFYAFYADCP
nr:hypothetical protein GCM10020093_120660 [Planobispora longispora]